MNYITLNLLNTTFLLLFSQNAAAYTIPEVYSNIVKESNTLAVKNQNNLYQLIKPNTKYSLKTFRNIEGDEKGLKFAFPGLKDGTLYYGFIKLKDGKYNYPVFFKKYEKIKNGEAFIDITKMSGKYDMINWKEKGEGLIGYRVVKNDGKILYDGKVAFRGKSPFFVDTFIISGPFVNKVNSTGAVISFDVNHPAFARVEINDGEKIFYSENGQATHHEIKVFSLKPNTKYHYTIFLPESNYEEDYYFKTAPKKGSRQEFTFSYISDCRASRGGGERYIGGVNGYILKKVAAISAYKNAAFVQITGDVINGYKTTKEEMLYEYYNFKHILEPYWHYMPFYIGMGNHEALVYKFNDTNPWWKVQIDKFPFDTDSSEAVFAQAFVNFENGPLSEDNSSIDPDPNKIDFPSYKENVYSYTYANTAMIVLNSDYLYAPSMADRKYTGGNLHGYIMENQLKWFKKEIEKYTNDKDIDHIFVTIHTPLFPNGGHGGQDMWYNGNNEQRPIINGKEAKKGIIEVRDELLEIMMKSPKVVAILTGDEHNYNRMKITKDLNLYPKNWDKDKITKKDFFREIWQINNGAGGAPYYAKEKLPWSKAVKSFTTQNAVVFFHIKENSVEMETINPDTLDIIDKLKLK